MHSANQVSGISAGAMDAEHSVQLGLLRMLCDGVENGLDCATLRQIVEQLSSYSDAHFLSEQLLMRLYSYPGYDEHVLEHDRMMAALRDLEADVDCGADSFSAERAEALRQQLVEHIRSQDRKFSAFVGDLGGAGPG